MREKIRRAISGFRAGAVLIVFSVFMCAAVHLCAAEKSEESAEFYVRLGNAFMESGQYDKALAMFTKARSLAEESVAQSRIAAAHRGLADTCFEKGDYRSAVDHYENAKRLDPSAVDMLPKLEEAYLKLGARHLEDGNLSAVISATEKALAISPNSVETLRLKGEALVRKGDLEGARNQFTQIVKIARKDAEAQMRIGSIDEKLGKGKQATEVYSALIESDPQFVQAYVALGGYYEKRRNFKKAAEVYRKGIEKAPAEASLHGNLAWAYISDGNYLDAHKECQTALGLDPENAYVHNYFGLILMHSNRFSEAQESFKKAIALKPDYAGARLNLAFLYGTMGRSDDAIKEYKDILDKAPDNAEAHYNLGINYKKQGRFVLARYHLDRAAKLYGYDSKLGKRALERLWKQDGTKSQIPNPKPQY